MMRTSEMPEGTFILKDKAQALERYHGEFEEPRDVWAVYTSNAASARPVWVETGPVTWTQPARDKSQTLAIEAVQIRTGKTAVHVDYDP